MAAGEARRAVEAVWRIESARLIGGLARAVGDIGLAEDLAQDALLVALEQWPVEGVPANPGAWLMATARHKGVDRIRRAQVLDRKREQIAHELERHPQPDMAAAADDVGDDVLSLIFTACHPVLAPQARIALTLKLVGALGTAEIAHAFLVSEATVAQRIVRAKKALAAAGVAIEVPGAEQRVERLESVLEVLYATFNEGYSAAAGDRWMRPRLCEEALRLGRMLAALAPDEGEVQGLLALMELQASRMRARLDRDGAPVLLDDQDRARWDRLLIGRGLEALDRARAAGPLGGYGLQAEIAACHARAARPDATDWQRIAVLYDALTRITPSPVVELNRAVAVSRADGPEAGLELLDGLDASGELEGYRLLPAARGDMLERLGRTEDARAAFLEAADLARNGQERSTLLARAARAGDA